MKRLDRARKNFIFGNEDERKRGRQREKSHTEKRMKMVCENCNHRNELSKTYALDFLYSQEREWVAWSKKAKSIVRFMHTKLALDNRKKNTHTHSGGRRIETIDVSEKRRPQFFH